MGCGESKSREGQLRPGGKRVSKEEGGDELPDVPEQSWYGLPFTDITPMPPNAFGSRYAGMVLFNNTHFPTAPRELHRLPNNEPLVRAEDELFVLGVDHVFGMAYLHDTALSVEHAWRLRVNHNVASTARYEKPFYDTLVGIQVFINGRLVPDQKPHELSLKGCTATLNTHDAVSVWRCIPIPLLPSPDHFTVATIHIYRGLAYSFAAAAASLRPGTHAVRVDVVYGCRKENDFATEFIARGELSLAVPADSREAVLRHVARMERLVNAPPPEHRLIPMGDAGRCGVCPTCTQPAAMACTICGARVCGTVRCAWTIVEGYPFCCATHSPAF